MNKYHKQNYNKVDGSKLKYKLIDLHDLEIKYNTTTKTNNIKFLDSDLTLLKKAKYVKIYGNVDRAGTGQYLNYFYWTTDWYIGSDLELINSEFTEDGVLEKVYTYNGLNPDDGSDAIYRAWNSFKWVNNNLVWWFSLDRQTTKYMTLKTALAQKTPMTKFINLEFHIYY